MKSTLGEVGNGGSNDKVQASGILSVIFLKKLRSKGFWCALAEDIKERFRIRLTTTMVRKQTKTLMSFGSTK